MHSQSPQPTTPSGPRLHALVPCAGMGLRAGSPVPKQYALLAGRPMVQHTLQALRDVADLHTLLVVLSPDDDGFDAARPAWSDPRLQCARCGGATRAATVAAGLRALRVLGAHDDDWVLVHDAARCLVRPQWIQALIDACRDDEVGGLLALPLADTLKQARDGRAVATLPRTDRWLAQTPQMFRLALLHRALARAGDEVTDEASAVETLGLAPRLVRGDPRNLKLTWPQDFEMAEALLAHDEQKERTR